MLKSAIYIPLRMIFVLIVLLWLFLIVLIRLTVETGQRVLESTNVPPKRDYEASRGFKD